MLAQGMPVPAAGAPVHGFHTTRREHAPDLPKAKGPDLLSEAGALVRVSPTEEMCAGMCVPVGTVCRCTPLSGGSGWMVIPVRWPECSPRP